MPPDIPAIPELGLEAINWSHQEMSDTEEGPPVERMTSWVDEEKCNERCLITNTLGYTNEVVHWVEASRRRKKERKNVVGSTSGFRLPLLTFRV